MLCLAQVPSPTGAELLVFGSCVFFIGSGILLYLQIRVANKKLNEKSPARTIAPQPFEIKNFEEFATRSELEKLEEEMNETLESLSREYREIVKDMNKANEERVEKIHSRINTIAEEMPRKVIQLLKDTGHLRLPRDQRQ